MQQQCSIMQCSLTQYIGSTSLSEISQCDFNSSYGEAYTLPSVCIHSDLNHSSQGSVGLQVLHELKLFTTSQECLEGFKPWICRQLFTSCANNGSSEECEIFSSVCAEDTHLVMTSSLLRDVCFFSSTDISSGNGN